MTGESPSTPTPTPAPPPPAPPSAPTPPSPSPSPSPVERPSSFSDALAKEDQAAGSAPAPPAFREPDAFQPAQATSEQPPGPTEVPPVGEPPPERWPQILENARKKERDATTQQFQQQVQQLQPALQVIQKLNTDLPGTVGQLIREGLASPQHREGLRAELGRLFGSLRQQAQAAQQQQGQPAPPLFADDVEPERYVTIEGTQYFDPQADAKWQQWRERQLDKRYEEKFKPAMSLAEQVQKAQQIAAFQQQSKQTVEQRLTHWKTQPGFEQHKKAIGLKQQELYDQGLDEWTALGIAYAQVVPPLLQQQSQSSLTAQAVAKAAGRTDNPGAFASAPPRRPRTAKEALEQVGLT